MKTRTRIVLLAVLLCLTAGYVYLQTVPPAAKLATLMPAGALLYLESPDFGALVRDWDASQVKAEWLESENLPSVFAKQPIPEIVGSVRPIRRSHRFSARPQGRR